MNKSKLSALLSLAFVFVSGAVLGIFAYRLYTADTVQGNLTTVNAPPPPPQKRNPDDFRKWYVPTLTKELKLDTEQVKQLNAILDGTRDEFTQLDQKYKVERDAVKAQADSLNDKTRPERDAIHNRQVEQITAMLRDDQKQRYIAFRAERDRQRKQMHDQHKKQ
jgi:hypothetical protein